MVLPLDPAPQKLIRYLADLCLRPPAVTPTGEAWVFGHDHQRQNAGVFVILPER